MNVTGNEDIDIYCLAYNNMITTPVIGTDTGLEPLHENYVSAHHHVFVKGKIYQKEG